MKLIFGTPSYKLDDNCVGAASFGFAGDENELLKNSKEFPYDIQGKLYCGSYEECLAAIPEKKWQAGMVLLGNAGGENVFVKAVARKVNAPLVGGGAAIDPITGKSGLITGGGQAAVFLIDDPRYKFEVCCENIHHDILSEHEITFADPRIIEKIDGEEPVSWLKNKKLTLGLDENDFEHLTFADSLGINAHLSLQNGKICSGRDLAKQMYLRYVSKEDVYERMERFYDDEYAIVFGCAGLKGILPANLNTKGLGLFLFGEVCTKDGQSEFGNLMLSKIRVHR